MSDQDRRAIYRAVANLHTQNIDQGFLSTLGPGFLGLLYQAIDESPESALIVAYEDAAVCGFIAGTLNLKQVYRGLLLRWPALVVALTPSLLIPTRLWRIVEILRYSRGAGADSVSLPQAELLSLAVSPVCRGRGYAESLYAGLVRFFADREQTAFRIVVGAELARAHRFYRRMGAEPRVEIAVHRGAASTVYVQTCAAGYVGGVGATSAHPADRATEVAPCASTVYLQRGGLRFERVSNSPNARLSG